MSAVASCRRLEHILGRLRVDLLTLKDDGRRSGNFPDRRSRSQQCRDPNQRSLYFSNTTTPFEVASDTKPTTVVGRRGVASYVPHEEPFTVTITEPRWTTSVTARLLEDTVVPKFGGTGPLP